MITPGAGADLRTRDTPIRTRETPIAHILKKPMKMPALSSTTEFIALLRQSGIYQSGAFDEAMAKVPDLPEDPNRAAAVCVQRGILTRFQAKLLLSGRSRGFRLGQYVILDQLGQGGMGTVFLAEHTTLRRHAALKVLNPAKDASESHVAIERFLREARAAAALDHPNIVRIHDIAMQGSIHYIALEYVDGQTLEQMLQKGGPITPSRAIEYIAQAAAGLQHADERGFVHRDIKPSNLILTKDQKTLKILDMGLARSFTNEDDKLTEKLDNGGVAGTVDFISPEQSLGHIEVDIRADIYSLGATFFTLIAGKPPFQGNTTQKLAQHQMKPAPSLTEIDRTLPRELAAVVAKMLAKKPKDRYQTPADVIAALGPWLGGNSRTNLPGGPALSEVALSNAPTERQEPSTASVDAPTRIAPDTLSEATANTERRTTRRRKRQKAAAAQRKKSLLIGVGLLGMLLLGVVGGVLAFGDSKKPEHVSNNPPANNPPANNSPGNNPPKSNPNPPRNLPPVAKPSNISAGDLLYHADFLNLKPGARAAQVGEKFLVQQLGGQNLPQNWALNHQIAAAADYMIADIDGVRALGIRHNKGAHTEVICRLDYMTTTQNIGETRVFRIVYQFEGTGFANAGMKLDKEPYTKFVLEPLFPSLGKWQQVEFTFTRTSTDPVGFICQIGPDPKTPAESAEAGGTLWIRSLDVWAGRVAAAPAAPVPAAPAVTANYAEWKEGATVYQSDLAAIPPFQVTKEGAKVQTGTPEQLPKGVRVGCWKPTATAEFRCESVAGSQTLALANLTSEKSGQIVFDLEREMNLRLSPGKVYRVAVDYTTQNNTTGALMVQSPDADFRSILRIPLSATAGMWKTASGEFKRKDGESVRLNLENLSVGEGNILYIRSIGVTELVKPG
jgi:eukaryotic-like serine/threonine-protein kinase